MYNENGACLILMICNLFYGQSFLVCVILIRNAGFYKDYLMRHHYNCYNKHIMLLYYSLSAGVIVTEMLESLYFLICIPILGF